MSLINLLSVDRVVNEESDWIAKNSYDFIRVGMNRREKSAIIKEQKG